MFKRSAKEIQSYSQPDAEIKKPTHLFISVKGSTTEPCTVGKFVLNVSYAEFNRDTQRAVCWRAPTEKARLQDRNKLRRSIPAQIMPTIRLVVCVQLLGNAIGKQWHYSNLIEINKFA